jgi:hypothetical protein
MGRLFHYIGRFFDLHILGLLFALSIGSFLGYLHISIITSIISFLIGMMFLYIYMHELSKSKGMVHTFYKDSVGVWYIHLPEFLEAGLGTKMNLMMVDGADTFLDRISKNGRNVTVYIRTSPYSTHEHKLEKLGLGMNKEVLDAIGHAPVDYGAYYKCDDHILWLCPVTEYVFNGSYPDNIYISVLK